MRGSPFGKNPGGGQPTFVKTTFMAPPDPLSQSPGAWTFNLGKIDLYSADPELVHRYEFALGVIVTDPVIGVVRHYGEDPEMDVGD